jgi:EAL domain-containing protein (putative c-di-GMP-specific phosphodiesterase class I)
VHQVSVNLSTRDLLDQDLPDKFETILRRHRAVADGFCLEITERAILADPQRAQGLMNHLAARGFKLAIDDFGAGASSLATLKRLPLSEIKIGPHFVMALAEGAADGADARIVRSTIALARSLDLSVVAEGVENAAVLGLLQSLDCDEVQGLHLSEPLPVAEFFDWVARWQTQAPAAAGMPAELRRGTPLLH